MTQRPASDTGLPPATTVKPRASMPESVTEHEDTRVVVATRNHDLIRAWARRNSAEPATGEETPTGHAKVDVHDGGARIRFNFPAAAFYRPISWEEWLALFDRDRLVFVSEPEDASTGVYGRQSKSYYRLLPAGEWSGDLV